MGYIHRIRTLIEEKRASEAASGSAPGDESSPDFTYAQMDSKARAWAAGLDRESLGSFAVDIDTFVAVQIHRVLLHENAYSGGAGFLGDLAKYAVDDAMEDAVGGFYLDYALRARAEVFYWWSLGYSTKKLETWAKHVLKSDREFAVYGESIPLLHKYPEYHSFFDAGIWDTALIARCVENGVDPQMAGSLV